MQQLIFISDVFVLGIAIATVAQAGCIQTLGLTFLLDLTKCNGDRLETSYRSNRQIERSNLVF